MIGQFNATGGLSSSGASIREIVKNLRGKFGIVSRGFLTSGFDVASLSLNMPKIKRIEQSEAVGKYFLNSGKTEFGGMSSYIQISAGIISFDNISLSNPVLRSTLLKGNIDLNNWTMELESTLGLISADNIQVNIPLKTISQKIPETQLIWDYNGIVKYWEDKFYGGRI
ncbi:MAG TPA: hypothetical protein DIV86_07310 [Alphaproteobacteria bacterium]|nr:hypothetical protein [Alphaproteobacteria bacterium]